MRHITLAVLCFTLAISGPAVAGSTGYQLNPAVLFELVDCASGGSAAMFVTPGQYVMRVTDADVFVCYAATCASGGARFPVGTVMGLQVGGTNGNAQVMSCRSTASNGDLLLVGAAG